MRIQDTLKLGQETLKKNKIKTFELDAEVLMTKILDMHSVTYTTEKK